jgi:hypothetical protein
MGSWHVDILPSDDSRRLMFGVRQAGGSSHVQAPSDKKEFHSYHKALDWWIERSDLYGAAGQLGRHAIEQSLRRRLDTDLDNIAAFVDAVAMEQATFTTGPVHGDLHAQNVLVDDTGALYLIDFGWCAERWRAVDFLMMECSLKFLVTPRYADIDDLLEIDQVVTNDGGWLTPPFYGTELRKIAECVRLIRRLALELGAVEDSSHYLKGLTLLTAGLTSMPYRINHIYMLHSLGALKRQLGA